MAELSKSCTNHQRSKGILMFVRERAGNANGLIGGRCSRTEMAWISGGTFRMGSAHQYPEEAPSHRVTVDGFLGIGRLSPIASFASSSTPRAI
jgi:formylglycine-generating enzyme required for sulfatase activity